ncbi:DNA repair protein RadA [Quadrisphaera sp. DSM 44207]|uniref:DNA repair protein RadA n=1 Tax=Quadrisphaera sp. DSM 44207 TaxID=1881057 RepID=UPI0008920955|nr:DNA repair protein RadA [Quadrisphaera sp. DSM 44207]SDQ16404.1 DNA repair protein RadA/Sms [Quadrisphaera sp. DSM 44207]
MSSRAGRARPTYRCAECGWTSAKWVGRCGECQAWGTVEEAAAAPGRTAPVAVSTPARPIAEIDVEPVRARPTGMEELDRVLGGGLVPGAVVLLSGEPGVGKSTLLLDVASRAAASGRTVLYVTGEESAGQVRLRAERIGALRPRLFLAAEGDLGSVLGQVEAVRPDLLVVDSVQTVASADVEGAAGGVAQVREVAAALVRAAKERAMATLLVGHVTKDGSLAGPRVLEHLVDVVCSFEGDRHSRLRVVRAVKNRFGPTDEVGCFDLSDTGITGLTDPSGLFLSRFPGEDGAAAPVPGTCVTVTVEGRRPLVTEVQALVAATSAANPRRTVSGLDSSRVAMVVAVLTRRCRLPLAGQDVYVATVGGVRLGEPAADLATALALVSATTDVAVPAGTVAFGEIGLAGEVRPVPGLQRRLSEAARLGFTTAVVPAGAVQEAPDGITVVPVTAVSQAVTTVLADSAGASARP